MNTGNRFEDSSHNGNMDPRQQYDADISEAHGQVVYEHRNYVSMAAAIGQEEIASRVFSFTQNAMFGGLSQRIGFVSADGTVHSLTHEIDTNDKNEAVNTAIWGPIRERNLHEADGTIRVDDRDGHVYQMFITDDPEEPGRVEQQVQAWTEDVRQVAAKQRRGFIQYLHKDNHTVVDYTLGSIHFVTTLDPEAGYTLDYIKADLPAIPMQDNASVLRWGRVIEA